MLNPDFNALLSIFNDRKGKYLVVGGTRSVSMRSLAPRRTWISS